MKKISLFILTIALSLSSFAQMADTSYRQTMQKDLLRKSRNQKTAAFILAGVGGAMVIGGLLAGSKAVSNNNDPFSVLAGASVAGAASGFALVGGLAVVTSIPFFIASGKNKKKANSLSAGISFERIMQEGVVISRQTCYPALSARIRL